MLPTSAPFLALLASVSLSTGVGANFKKAWELWNAAGIPGDEYKWNIITKAECDKIRPKCLLIEVKQDMISSVGMIPANAKTGKGVRYHCPQPCQTKNTKSASKTSAVPSTTPSSSNPPTQER